MSDAYKVYPKYWWDNEESIITPAIKAVHASIAQFRAEQLPVIQKAIDEAEAAAMAVEQEFNANTELVAFGEFLATADDATKGKAYDENPTEFRQRYDRYYKALNKVQDARQALMRAKGEASTMDEELQDAVPELIFCAGRDHGLTEGARLLLSYLAPQLKQAGVIINLPASVLALLADKPSAAEEGGAENA